MVCVQLIYGFIVCYVKVDSFDSGCLWLTQEAGAVPPTQPRFTYIQVYRRQVVATACCCCPEEMRISLYSMLWIHPFARIVDSSMVQYSCAQFLFHFGSIRFIMSRLQRNEKP